MSGDKPRKALKFNTHGLKESPRGLFINQLGPGSNRQGYVRVEVALEGEGG